MEPLDDVRCNFILSRPVTDAPGVHKFTSAADAAESPVAQAVFQGVQDEILLDIRDGAPHEVVRSVRDPRREGLGR